MKFTTEDQIEAYNLELLNSLSYHYKHGSLIEPEGAEPERQSFGDVLSAAQNQRLGGRQSSSLY